VHAVERKEWRMIEHGNNQPVSKKAAKA